MGEHMPCLSRGLRLLRLQAVSPPDRVPQLLRRPVALGHRETPQPLQQLFLPAVHQHPLPGKNQEHVPFLLPGRPGLRKPGKLLRRPLGPGTAKLRQRAPFAVRGTGNADRRPQIHHRLVMVPGALLRHQFLRQFPDAGPRLRFRRIVPQPVQPANYPDDVAVHRGHGHIIGNGSNGAGGIGADAPDPSQGLRIPGDFPAEFLADLLRSPVKVPGPGIVPQPFPHLQHILFPGLRQRPDRRKAGHEARIIIPHGVHPGLLQHNLADPGSVGIPDSPPGHLPGVFIPPAQQRFRCRMHAFPPLIKSPRPKGRGEDRSESLTASRRTRGRISRRG